MTLMDIHAHILPNLDDGASSLEESLAMIEMAQNQGIEKIIATSHHSPQFPNKKKDVLKVYQKLRRRLAGQSKVQIFCGQEIFYSEDTVGQLKAGELLTMAGSFYVLIEFMPFDSFGRILQGCSRLLSAGYGVILAHVERYGCLRRQEHLDELLEMGVKLQMNFHSIGDIWYKASTRWCRKVLREQKIHFLGTDMHNVTSRKPETRKAVRWMKKNLDASYLDEVCQKNCLTEILQLSDVKNE